LIEDLEEIDGENFFETEVVPYVPIKRKRKRKSSASSDEISEENGKRFKYTAFVSSNKVIANTSLPSIQQQDPLPNTLCAKMKSALMEIS
jgi:hypothetical protein